MIVMMMLKRRRRRELSGSRLRKEAGDRVGIINIHHVSHPETMNSSKHTR